MKESEVEPTVEPTEELIKPVEEPTEPTEPVEEVSLTKEQYNALLDRIDELELMGVDKRDLDPATALAKEGAKPSSQLTQKDLDEMSNKELASHIFKEVGQYGQNVLSQVQKLEVLRELDKCEVKHKDFWDYEKEVHQLAVANPTLSIEQCYKLAKGNNPKEPKTGEDSQQRTRTERLLNLPKRSTGEKPSITPGATKVAKVMSLEEAAAEAMKEMEKR